VLHRLRAAAAMDHQGAGELGGGLVGHREATKRQQLPLRLGPAWQRCPHGHRILAHMLVMALDVGTSSARARVFDAAGRALRSAEGHVTYEPSTSADGGVELDPHALMAAAAEALDRCVAGAGARAARIAAVGVSVFWHSLLALDGTGRPL